MSEEQLRTTVGYFIFATCTLWLCVTLQWTMVLLSLLLHSDDERQIILKQKVEVRVDHFVQVTRLHTIISLALLTQTPFQLQSDLNGQGPVKQSTLQS